jgi:mannose-6-phosphate isomerase-like protein (cupin superfamily)
MPVASFSRIAVAALFSFSIPANVFATEPPFKAASGVVSADRAPWLTYDAGKLRILASAASTGGRYSVLELDELSAYKTPPHMHPGMDETFYVLEGTLELRLPGKTYRLGVGSYAHVPRNTPHAQGSADDKPVRVLVTVSPGEFEAFFLDRVGLMSRTPRSHPDFQRLYLEIVRKHSKWLRPASLEPPSAESR